MKKFQSLTFVVRQVYCTNISLHLISTHQVPEKDILICAPDGQVGHQLLASF